MLKLVAKIFKLNPNGLDRGLFWIALAVTLFFALWYVLVVTGQKGRPWYRVNFWGRFVTNDRKIIWAYIIALVAWPVIAGIAIFPVVPLWVRMVAATLLVGLVLWEMYQGANRFLEYIPLGCIIVFAIVIMYAIKNTMLEVIKATTGDPTYGQQLLCNWPRAALILVIAAIISSMLLTWTKVKLWWLPKLIALIVVVIMLAVQAWSLHEAKAEAAKEKGDNKGATLSVSPSVTLTPTATLTPTPDPDPAPDDVARVLSLSKHELELLVEKYHFSSRLICKNSLPEMAEDRKFEDAISTPFGEKMALGQLEELKAELLNPVWLRARFGYLEEVRPEYGCFREYNELYDKYGIEYFMEDATHVTTEYLRYAVIGAMLLEHVEVSHRDVQTEYVWRQDSGSFWKKAADGSLVLDLGVKKRKYSEADEFGKVLVIRHILKDGKGYYEYINVYDKAPVIPKEPKKPTPTPKPTSTPTPKPTSTPTPKPTSTPTPTPKPTSTPTPKPTATPTPTNTPTPTYPPKDKTESSTGGKEENKPNPVNETFTGATPTPKPTSTPTPTPKPTSTPTGTPKPTATPTPTPTPAKPRSSKDESSTSLNEDLIKANDQMAEANAETQISVTPKPAIVPDCDNPGKTKEVPGTVYYGDYPEVVGAPTLAVVMPEGQNQEDTSVAVPWGGSGY